MRRPCVVRDVWGTFSLGGDTLIISEGSETVEFNGEFLWFFHGDMANNIREVNTAIAVKN